MTHVRKAYVYVPKPKRPAIDHDLSNLSDPPPLDPRSGVVDFAQYGDQLETRFLERAIRSFPRGTRDMVWAFFVENWDLDLGTICSGTEAPLLFRNGLAAAVKNIWDLNLRWGSKLVCEKDENTRKFIDVMFPRTEVDDPATVRLAESLATDCATVWDEKLKRHVSKPFVNGLWYGFPCQSVSSCCNDAKTEEHRSCIANGDLKSGTVFMAITEYLKFLLDKEVSYNKSSFMLGMFENVRGLQAPSKVDGLSNLDYVVHALEELDFWVLVFMLEPREQLQQVSPRHRLYGLHIPKKLFGKVQESELRDFAESVLDFICGASEPSHIKSYLHMEDSPRIRSYYRKLCLARRGSSAASSPAKPKRRPQSRKWAVQHYTECKRMGKDWTKMHGPSKETRRAFPGLRALNKAHFDSLAIRGVKYPEKVGRSIDLSQSFVRQTLSKHGKTNTVKPKMVNYLTDICRATLGDEGLQLMNLHFGATHARLSEFEDGFLQIKAGNAFELRSCSAASLTGICCLAYIWFRNQAYVECASTDRGASSSSDPEQIEETRFVSSASIWENVGEGCIEDLMV